MASVRERRTLTGETSWAVLARDGSRQTSRTFATEKTAKRFAKLVDALGWHDALATLDTIGHNPHTVGNVVDGHVDALSGITEGTRSDYKAYRRDLGALAEIPVESLTRAAVGKWVNELATRLSGKSIRNRHSLLSAALTRAQRDGLIGDNPAKGVRLPTTVRREPVFLTHADFAHLLDALPPYWHPLVVTLAGTGMRWGEATALAVKDVDVDHNTVHVRQGWKHTDGKGRELGPPKTKKGRRTITAPPEVMRQILPLLVGKGPDDLVFLNRQGRPVNQSTFLVHVWQPAVKQLGKTPRVHDLRHTHASWLIAAGVPLPVIQARLGHESIQTTVDTYGHLSSDSHLLAARAASVALGPSFPAIEPDLPALTD